MKRLLKLIPSLVALFLLTASCAQVKNLANTLINLKNLEFSLDNIESVELAGIRVGSKSKLSDFSTSDVLKLTTAASSKNMPITFNLLVEAFNPNASKDGKTINSNATITDFPFELFIDEVSTMKGNISSDVKVPGNGSVIFPLSIGFEMFDMFKGGGYQKMGNLALNLSGFETDKINLKLRAKPQVTTPIGNLNPGEITILNKKL